MEDDAVILSSLGQGSEVLAWKDRKQVNIFERERQLLTSAWCLLGEELDGDGTESGVQSDLVSALDSASWCCCCTALLAAKHALELVHVDWFGDSRF